ncbi:MAG TPA: glycerophosphodiester phosphodiesterase [Mycobacteriales bacterium]|nr:glycerophosphodiester phosphodiesterase [Mycobacteriales bacterium]
MTRPLAIAHRAGNSLAGLHAAVELGADVIECDIHHHRGQLEVRHLKTAGPLPFLWDKWELTRASAPRLGLRELLTAADHGTLFMLDLKGRSSVVGHKVADLLHELAPSRPVIVCGRYWPAVESFRSVDWVRRVLSARNRAELALLRRTVRAAPAYGVSIHRSLLDPVIVAELHESVEVVMTWPINDLTALDEVVGKGVTGVISDEMEILRALLSR